MERAEKQAEVELLTERFSKAEIAICADYRGLTVLQVTKLRKQLFNAGFSARVSKNTLFRLAANKALSGAPSDQLEKLSGNLVGPSMVIFSDNDPVGPAKIAAEFSKEHEKFQIKGAWFEGKFVDASGVKALSTMPGKEETLSKLLALLNTPATQLLRVMKAPAEQFARLLGAYKDKLEKGS